MASLSTIGALSDTTSEVSSLLQGERPVWSLKAASSPRASKPKSETSEAVPGVIVLTTYRIRFVPHAHMKNKSTNSERASDHTAVVNPPKLLSSVCNLPSFYDFPLGTLSHYEQVADTFVFYLKDCRFLAFDIHKSERLAGKIEPFALLVDRYAFCDYPVTVEAMLCQSYLASPTAFAFTHGIICKSAKSHENLNSSKKEPEFVFDMEKELIRLGLINNVRSKWRKSVANSEYLLCPTYPSVICVPGRQTDKELKEAAQFRSRQRLPVACFMHPKTSAALLRCSQPYVGLRGKRSDADEKLLLQSETKYILDCRPKKSAMANLAAGKGYENPMYYPELKGLQFCDIENIHSVRKSYTGITDLFLKAPPSSGRVGSSSSPEDNSWLSALENTNWLKHIRLIMASSDRIASLLSEGDDVLVHCSDGWDRTAQVCAMAELLIDPFYRTLCGFATLVEKEWCAFGHQFSKRCGHGNSNYADDQRSPVFIQWLDCIWQLLYQFPTAFEFNEGLLQLLAESLYSCQYGTFLYNCERQRVNTDLKARTESIWPKAFKQEYRNPIYNPDTQETRLRPQCFTRCLSIWPFHYRFNVEMLKSSNRIAHWHSQAHDQ